jgi:uncharacterized protein YndB with AHSA1/START domain
MNLDLKYTEFIPHPVPDVWAALTTADALREWLMESDYEPRVGKHFIFRCPPGPGNRGFIECTVLELEPMRRVVWSWLSTETGDPTIVTFELEPAPGGTKLTLTHRGDTTPDTERGTRAGWTSKLSSLLTYLNGRPHDSKA